MSQKILRRAEKQIRKLPKTVQIAIGQQLRELDGGGTHTEKKLQKFENLYRLRAGNYRVVYEKKDGDVFVLLAEHRKDIYQSVEKLLG
ncbi:type II toxin-antitoxin system RelE/ParE family toxin [Candidatus Woesebacteria bacterium]|nr:type II toxin-antitoxin system RelE/ParE family toxin [Candidatus Woesebacteria bacterium]